jgi:hypothetical protein
MTWADAHADHADPWPFRRIKLEWMAEHGFTADNLPEIASVELSTTLADPALAADFKDFHDQRAKIMIVLQRVNLGKKK